MKKLDCRGMPCPQPVLATKDAIEASPNELIEVIVDNKASMENVSRFLKSQGWAVSVNEMGKGCFMITGAPGTCEIKHEPSYEAHEQKTQRILIIIPTDIFGAGNDELGVALMKNFIGTLKEFGSDLWRIVLLNGGVRLSTKDSPVLEELKDLEASGVDVLVCGTCLNFFDLHEKKAVGQTTNMLDIVTSMQLATKVIRI